MKKQKQLLALCGIICLLGMGVLFPAEKTELFQAVDLTARAEETATSGTCGENLTWNFDKTTGTLTISGTGTMQNYTYTSNAPWYSNREAIKKVVLENGMTDIGAYSFYGCENLTSITIPNGVTRIGSGSFRDAGLTSITLPDGVKYIESIAFKGCSSLTSVTIPDSVTNIGGEAFFMSAQA